MSLLKTYTISTDITTGDINEDVLQAEISAAGHVISYDGLSVRGDALTIFGDSLSNETALDALVLAHIIEPLAKLKAKRYEEIDKKSKSLISDGFTYDSKTFSLSMAAQRNWDKLKHDETEFSWPMEISTTNDDVYLLAQANISEFWTAHKNQIWAHLDSGRTLKKEIFDAANKTVVDTIIDTR